MRVWWGCAGVYPTTSQVTWDIDEKASFTRLYKYRQNIRKMSSKITNLIISTLSLWKQTKKLFISSNFPRGRLPSRIVFFSWWNNCYQIINVRMPKTATNSRFFYRRNGKIIFVCDNNRSASTFTTRLRKFFFLLLL